MSRTRSFLSDFKDFINKGNVVDLAVAVVIGGAFGKVVDAVVSLVMGSLLEPAMKAANVASIASWPAGSVIVALINFVVIAFVVFLIVRVIEASRAGRGSRARASAQRRDDPVQEAGALDAVLPLRAPRGGAGGVVAGRVREDRELLLEGGCGHGRSCNVPAGFAKWPFRRTALPSRTCAPCRSFS